MYQFFWFSSYWIGCPISPGILSLTILWTVRTPPFVLILSTISFPERASLTVFANLILSAANPVVIAKYFLPSSIPSGVLPSSAKTRTDSPLRKLWFVVKEITFEVILFATPTLPTVNFFSDTGPSPLPSPTSINIGDENVVRVPSIFTFRYNLSSFLAPILYPLTILVGGLVISFSPSI